MIIKATNSTLSRCRPALQSATNFFRAVRRSDRRKYIPVGSLTDRVPEKTAEALSLNASIRICDKVELITMGEWDKNQNCRQRGFTLVEMVFVVVILGIIASIGSSFVVTAVDSYRVADTRNKLVQRGRLTLEQIARELRMAVPNSIRISSSHRCMEFLPIIAATDYRSNIATAENNASAKNFVNTSSYELTWGSAAHAVIAAYNPLEIYTNAIPATRVSIATSALGNYAKVDFSSAHRFVRESQTRRIFIAADPVRYCVLNNQLQRISNFGFDTNTLTDSLPSGTIDLMAQDVQPEGSAFELSPGSEDRNAAVAVSLQFSSGKAQMDLRHQVLIRNVP